MHGSWPHKIIATQEQQSPETQSLSVSLCPQLQTPRPIKLDASAFFVAAVVAIAAVMV